MLRVARRNITPYIVILSEAKDLVLNACIAHRNTTPYIVILSEAKDLVLNAPSHAQKYHTLHCHPERSEGSRVHCPESLAEISHLTLSS